MARPICIILALAFVGIASAAGAHELGDFGRFKPGVLNDKIVPGLDYFGKVLTNQPHSSFNWTDEENEMHDRVVRFLYAPYAKDWAFEYGGEIKKASTSGAVTEFVDRYYRWLSREEYESSRVRYNSMSADEGADLGTLPATFDAICAVEEIDRRRGVAGDALDTLEPKIRKDLAGRLAENDNYVSHFVAALTYRYAAYSYALDRLLVETPHAEAQETDARLSELATWVDRAASGDFCGQGFVTKDDGGGNGGLRSRVLIDAPNEGPFKK